MKDQLGYEFNKFDKKFNDAQIKNTIIASLKAGVLGGLLGIGGGVTHTGKYIVFALRVAPLIRLTPQLLLFFTSSSFSLPLPVSMPFFCRKTHFPFTHTDV